MLSGASETVHATCVAVSGTGVLLLGPSGSGKSDLALRLIGRGVCTDTAGVTDTGLVSDDYVTLTVSDGRLVASPPATIAGRLEVRGVGLIAVPYVHEITLGLAIELVMPAAVPRLPDRDAERLVLLGIAIPKFRLAPFEASTPDKLRAAVHAVTRSGFTEEIDRGGTPA